MEPTNLDHLRISNAVSRLTGHVCWKVLAGKGTGSVVHLGFGEKIRRLRELKNPTLPLVHRQYDAAMSILLHSGWRLSEKGRVICGWRDYEAIQGEASCLLAELENSRLLDAHVRSPAYDLSLTFEGEVVLDVFCDQTNSNEADENYNIFLPQEILTVGVRSVLMIETRSTVGVTGQP